MKGVRGKGAMVTVQPNANFHTVTSRSVFDVRSQEERFREYRRRWMEYPRSFTVGDFPIHLDIESTAVCNLSCPFCAKTSKNWGPRKAGYMRMDMFRRIIDEGVANGLFSIKLSFRGEPMLHQQLAEMVAYAKDKGILDVYFNTNATLLNEKNISELIDAGLDRISVSFEGTSKEVYEGYRVGARYEDVIERVKLLHRIRNQRGTPHPQIRLQTVLTPALRDSFAEYTAFWRETADEVAYLDMRRESPLDDHRGYIANWACPFLWQRMVILWDGTLLPCLMHGVSNFELMALGNVKEMRIREAWLGEPASYYRQLHRNGQSHHLEACDRCSFRAMELEKLGIEKSVPRTTTKAEVMP